MKSWQEIYAERCAMRANVMENLAHGTSDICEHLPTLRQYAAQCKHVTEFGTRNGSSTAAFLCGLLDAGSGVLRSYDIHQTGLKWDRERDGVRWEFVQADTQNLATIDETDLLFVDASHEYRNVAQELTHHAKVRRWIIMHDTALDWVPHGGPGVRRARDEFLAAWAHVWEVEREDQNCNGLTVIRRK